MTKGSNGYVILSKEGKVIFGELCDIDRLREILKSTYGDRVELIVSSDDLAEYTMEDSIGRIVSFKNVQVAPKLDIKKMLVQNFATLRIEHKADCRIILCICAFFVGVLTALISGIKVRDTLLEGRYIQLEQEYNALKVSEEKAESYVDLLALYNEIIFSYDVVEILSLSDEEGRITSIFLSPNAGLQPIRLSALESQTLIKGAAVTKNTNVYYLYTIEGFRKGV
jgi:hypothetical protein